MAANDPLRTVATPDSGRLANETSPPSKRGTHFPADTVIEISEQLLARVRFTQSPRHAHGGACASTRTEENHAARLSMSSSLKGFAMMFITSWRRSPLRYARSWLDRKTAGWPARFGASGWVLRPSAPWQTAHGCAFARPAIASAATAASPQCHSNPVMTNNPARRTPGQCASLPQCATGPFIARCKKFGISPRRNRRRPAANRPSPSAHLPVGRGKFRLPRRASLRRKPRSCRPCHPA